MFASCTQKSFRSLNASFWARFYVKTTEHNYTSAIAALNSIQSNFATIEHIRKSGGRANEVAIEEMVEWCQRAGVDIRDLYRLNAIHIAGTKGKGSTAAFVSSILSQYVGNSGAPTKLGLYTSPHLRSVRERIQISNAPISEQEFANLFFEVWTSIEKSTCEHGYFPKHSSKPTYFRFLTIMAFKLFLEQNVDTAIIECGIGGEYDSTNVLHRPLTTGITSLGIDHIHVLGSTIEEIAWHKAGIIKAGAPLFTVPQSRSAMEILQKRADERNAKLYVIECHPQIASGGIKLGLQGEFQKYNASLAVAIAASHLQSLGHPNINKFPKLPQKFVDGLSRVVWPGRCETLHEDHVTWYLDGAHTIESIEAASQWFASCLQKEWTETASSLRTPRVLIFNQQTRLGAPLLRKLHEVMFKKFPAAPPFTHAIFCSNMTFAKSGYKPDLVSINNNAEEDQSLSVQTDLANTWKEIDGGASIHVTRSIDQAIAVSRKVIADNYSAIKCGGSVASPIPKAQVFIVGSVHLVGGALEVLDLPAA